jgi:hypothetical protein
MNFSADYINKLKIEVAVRNSVNAKLNEAGAKLKLVFNEFVGHRIQVADRKLTKKHQAIADAVLQDCGLFFDKESLRYNEGFKFYVKSGPYSLVLVIDQSYEFAGRPSFVEGCMYFASVRDKFLEVGQDLHVLRTDYDAESIMQDMAEVDRLTKQADSIKNIIHEFQDFRGYR